MKIDIDSASAIGDVVRASRKAQKIRQRLHVIDACQLPSLDRNFKYSQGSMENLSLLSTRGRSSAVTRTRLFWLASV